MNQMSSQLLQIFAKAPVLGQVKTRLASDIGEQKACDVYQSLLFNTVKNTHSTDWQSSLWCTPDVSNSILHSLGQEYNLPLHNQPQGDIGERMLFALCKGLTIAKKVVLIGSDCPVITSAYLSKAFDALDASNVIFSPAEDGGYVLIGCNKTNHQMFKNVTWSVAETLEQNIFAIKSCGLSYQLLPMLWDVDTLEDLTRWQKSVNEMID